MSSSNENSNDGWISNHDLANQVISKYTGKSSSNNNKRKSAPIVKDDDEYQKKRARNNVAVKKSREKAKNRIQETQERVEHLSKENEELQTKVNLLSKELNVLRALFTNGGFTLPCDLQYANNNSTPSSEHGSTMSYSPHSRIPSDEPVMSQTSPLHSSYESEKPTYHSIEDTKSLSKIPPLRPMPRIPSTTSSHKHPIHPSSLKYPDRLYNIPSKQDYIQKDSKAPINGLPLLIQPGSQSIQSNIHTPQHKGDTRHPSVIRSTTEVSAPSNQNPLGKFCIIKDPHDNGQIKMLPINS